MLSNFNWQLASNHLHENPRIKGILDSVNHIFQQQVTLDSRNITLNPVPLFGEFIKEMMGLKGLFLHLIKRKEC